MSLGSRIHLLGLIDREFKRETKAPRLRPARTSFKGIQVSLEKYAAENGWDKKRGRAARLMSIVLREDSNALHQRVCSDEQATKTYDQAADWLQREARYLRKVAALQEVAASRLTTVLERCRAERQVPISTVS